MKHHKQKRSVLFYEPTPPLYPCPFELLIAVYDMTIYGEPIKAGTVMRVYDYAEGCIWEGSPDDINSSKSLGIGEEYFPYFDKLSKKWRPFN